MTAERDRCSYEYEYLLDADQDSRVDVPRPTPPHRPHPTFDTETGQCLFHPMDEDYPADRATEAFLDALDDEDRVPTFSGAYVPALELAGEVITLPDQQPLDLRGAISMWGSI